LDRGADCGHLPGGLGGGLDVTAMRGDYEREMLHRSKLARKYERLQGLRDLYATYEQAGEQPYPGSYMAGLRQRIASTQNQLKAMAGSWEDDER
jgi:hypothetical protein